MVEIRSKNVVIWGFHSKSSVIAINTLREKKLIDIKAWIGDAQECTIYIKFKKESVIILNLVN